MFNKRSHVFLIVSLFLLTSLFAESKNTSHPRIAEVTLDRISSSAQIVIPRIRDGYLFSAIQSTERLETEWCGTLEWWESHNGGLRSCDLQSPIDDPATRDSHIPDVNTPIKTFRLLIHAFADANGTSPTTTLADAEAQLLTLNEVYLPYRIRFEALFQIHNDSQYQVIASADWSAGTLKELYAGDPTLYHNVYVVDTDANWGILGVSTFPWDNEALTVYGGTLIDKDWFGGPRDFNGQINISQHTITHELGHALGLWHTHHGVTEVGECGPCYEGADGYVYDAADNADLVGDFCSDTKATPVNFTCADPTGSDCQGNTWVNTDVHNFMGYADDDCYNANGDGFSTQQSGRVHGWINEKYTGLLDQSDAMNLLSVGFEDGMPQGWTVTNNDGDGNQWIVGVEDESFDLAHYGNNGAAVFFNAAGNDDWLMTPQIVISANETTTFSFWARSHDSSFLETFNVKLSTGTTSISDFSTSLGSVIDAPSGWTQYSYDLTAYAGQSIYLAVQCVSIDEWALFVDDYLVSLESGTTSGDTEVTIGTGTDLGSQLPIYAYFGYSYSQTIYVQSEINNAGNINEIKYHYNGNSAFTDSIEIYMGTTTRNDFSIDNTWFNTTSDISKVYNGILEVTAVDEWVSILLDTPFSYDNNENLIIAVHEKTAGYHGSSDNFYATSFSNSRSLNYRSDNTDIDPSNPMLSPTQRDYIPNTQLVFGTTITPTLTANFTATPLSGDYPLTVQFTDVSTGSPTLWNWDFDDNSSVDSEVQNPSYTYTTPGTYAVTLFTSNATESDTETKVSYITVTTAPILTADFSADVMSGTAPLTVNFTDLSINATSWSWDFNSDGTEDASVQNPSYTFTEADSYSVDLTVSNGTGTDVETKANYIVVSNGVEGEYSIPLAVDYWGKVFSGPVEATTDGLKVSTTGYRNGNWVISNETFDLVGKDIYLKWLKHDGGSYMRGTIGILKTEARVGDISTFSADTWFYSRIRINADKTVEAVTSTGDYDDASSPGALVDSTPSTITDESWINVQNGKVYFYFGDTRNTEAYLTVGEVKIGDSSPINMETQSVYNFDDGLIPAEFTSSGAWSIDSSVPVGGNSLYINGNVGDYVSFTAINAVAIKIRFKILHDGGDTAPLAETATSLLLSRNDVGYVQMGVYVNGTTAVPSEWCEFTVPANSLGDANFSLAFSVQDGQKLWIDEIEVMNGGGEPIVADFSADPLSGTAPLEVEFTDQSVGATAWSWDFDNDGVEDAAVQNPYYTYSDTGSYSVALAVSDGTNSDEEIKSNFITVIEPVVNGVWTELSSGTSSTLESICFPSPLVGYAVGWDKTIIKTTDGGTTWTSVMDYASNNFINDVFFITEDLGWVCGSYGLVLKTMDGGLNWTEQYISNTSTWLTRIYFSDANNGFVTGNDGIWRKTSDGGNTWTDVSAHPSADIHFVDESTAYELVYDSIYKSTDGGETWALNYSLDTDDKGRGIFFTDLINGYVVGYNNDTTPDEGFILQTHDGGASWSRSYMENHDMEDIGFISPTTGFMVGNATFVEARIYKTTDQGTTWTVDAVLGTSINDIGTEIEITNTNTAYVVGKNGLIMRYIDDSNPPTITADFSATPLAGTAPLSVNFTDESTNVTSWSWDFNNDGTEDASVQNPSYTYTVAGSYSVVLTVSDGITSDAETKTDFIQVSDPVIVAESQWTWLNPTPQGKSIWDSHFVDGNIGYAAGLDGLFMKTVDGGSTWDVVDLGETNDFYAVSFVDANTGYIAGDGGMVQKTTDGGISGIELTTPFSNIVLDLYFSGANNGFAAGSGGLLYKTADGGSTWTEISHSAGSEDLNKILFIDASNGFIVGGTSSYPSSSAILKTTDGGSTWTSITSPVVNKLQEIAFVNSSVGYAGGKYGSMVKTTDGGSTWTEIATSVNKSIYGIQFSDENNGVIACEYDCYQTTDGGVNWTRTHSDNSFYAYSMAFASTTVGYVFGNSGHILKTEDTGTTWSFQNSFTRGSILSLDFYDDANAVAVGQDGMVLISSDGGASWVNRGVETPYEFQDVIYASANTIYAASNSGRLYQTTDNGSSWSTITTSSNQILFTIDAPVDQVMYAGGYTGHITKTLDNGVTWTSVNTPYDKYIYDILFSDALNGFAVGGHYSASKIFKTGDGGVSWLEIDAPVEKACRKIIFLDNMTALISGDDGMVLRSTDGGDTWVQISIGSYSDMMDMAFVDAFNGYIVGHEGNIFETNDAGLSWTKIDPPANTYYNTAATRGNDLFVGGYFGSLLKYASEGSSEVLTANFNANPLSGIGPLEVAFTDLSGGATTWSWDFNNDGTENANTQNPSYTYTDVGVYSVKLTISDGTNIDTMIKSDYINVEAPADDWDAQAMVVYDTDEADVIVRTGDIDNLGFGWPVDFDPFSGASTPAHGFPWAIDPSDAAGTDRIMVVSSYDGNPPLGSDGYTSATSRPGNIPEPISLSYDLHSRTVTSAIFQLFVDDLQAQYWGAEYSVSLDGANFPVMAEMINTLSQTGPIGKLITVPVTPDLLPLLNDGSVVLIIDDLTTGAGDGFAIDFAKLLINPMGFTNTGSITGVVVDAEIGNPIQGAEVWANNLTYAITNESGEYTLDNIVAGLVYLQVIVPGFIPQSVVIDLENDETQNYNFNMVVEEVAPWSFTLLQPAISEQVVTLTPTFTWRPAYDLSPLDTISYILYLDTPEPGVVAFDVGIDTTYQLVDILDDNTSYHWKVVARDLNGDYTENTGGYQSFTINTSNDLPVAFGLLSPVNDMMVTDLQPEFLWEGSSDPDDETLALKESGQGKGKFSENRSSGDNSVLVVTGYDFYLATDSLLTDAIPVEVIGTRYSPNTDLMENQNYYWAVSAIDEFGGETFSETASFWTNAENEAPAEFSLLLPTEEEILTTLSPTFQWESSSDPDLEDGLEYSLILWNTPEDLDTLWSGTDTSITLGWELEDNKTYYWTVYASDRSGLTTFNSGGHQSFTVNMGNDSPSVVDLITPDSVMVLSLTPEMFWTQAIDADPGDVVSYEMHWWGDGIEYDSVLTDTNAVILPRELEDNTQYFWDVITMDTHDGISHSIPATFWTDLEPEAPSLFALLSPEDDVDGVLPNVTFQWEAATDPDPFDYASYTIEISTDSTFNDIAYESDTGIDPGFAIGDDLLNDTEYWWRVVATDTDSLTTVSETYKFTVGYVAIAEGIALPSEYVLDQNFPNPFNPSTTLRYGLPEDSNVSLIIYDVLGNNVQTLESAQRSAGWYNVEWNGQTDDGRSISTGLYFARIVAGDYSQVIKMLYLK